MVKRFGPGMDPRFWGHRCFLKDLIDLSRRELMAVGLVVVSHRRQLCEMVTSHHAVGGGVAAYCLNGASDDDAFPCCLHSRLAWVNIPIDEFLWHAVEMDVWWCSIVFSMRCCPCSRGLIPPQVGCSSGPGACPADL